MWSTSRDLSDVGRVGGPAKYISNSMSELVGLTLD